jgi:UDP-glucuronate 4-epimerase
MKKEQTHQGTKTKKFLITGVAGFIGYHVALELLAKGNVVVGLDSITDYYDPRIKHKRLALLKKYKKFHFYKSDIAKYAALEKILKKERPTEIIHLAAQAGVRYSLSNPWAYVEANKLGTLNVFEAARRLGIPRVIYASSSSVYGANAKTPMSEDDRTDRQISVYGATKKANESLAHAYNHLHGTELVGLRFFTVYGTWGRPDLALFKFVKNMLSDKPIEIYNGGKMKRSFTHISDIVAGIMAVLERPPSGRNDIYNLGGAEAISLLDFVGLVEGAVGKKADKRMLPMQAGDVKETVADWKKAHKELGFTPKTSIQEGVVEFVAWFRANQPFLLNLRDPRQ